MAPKRKLKTASRKSKRRRVGKKPLRISRVPRWRKAVNTGIGFPKKVTMTHKYCEIVPLTSNASAMVNYQWHCNGMFKPNYTGTGHQPMFFDQMTALYDHYTVIGSKIVVKVTPYDTTAGQKTAYVGLFINDDPTVTPTAVNEICEQGSGSLVTMAPYPTNPLVLSKKWSAKKTFGGTVMSNNALQGSATSNPSENQLFTLVYSTVGGSVQTIAIEVMIEYIAVWTEIRDLASS